MNDAIPEALTVLAVLGELVGAIEHEGEKVDDRILLLTRAEAQQLLMAAVVLLAQQLRADGAPEVAWPA